ncbi:MAG: hypothetical protein QOF47_2962, partial [Mycobacterium sp.]|nr:hypothetical protein [Mycobacterium sp.]
PQSDKDRKGLSRNDSQIGLTCGNRLKPSTVDSPNSHLVVTLV